jgi:hypothetical protein
MDSGEGALSEKSDIPESDVLKIDRALPTGDAGGGEATPFTSVSFRLAGMGLAPFAARVVSWRPLDSKDRSPSLPVRKRGPGVSALGLALGVVRMATMEGMVDCFDCC